MSSKSEYGRKEKMMSEVKKQMGQPAKLPPPRAKEVIEAEYQKLCGELGQMKYNYLCLESQMNEHVGAIHKLKQETFRLKDQEPKEL